MRSQHTLLILIPLLALACAVEDTTPAAPTMVQPGTSTRELGSLRFGDAKRIQDADDGGDGFITTPCSMAMNAGSVAILEFKEGAYSVEQTESCDGPYASTMVIHPMRTLAVVAGEALAADFELVVPPAWTEGGQYEPQPGDIWLVTVRPARDQRVLTTYAPIDLDGDGSVQTSTGALYPVADFPETFEGLVETFEPLVEDLATQCPEEAQERTSEDFWDRIIFDPTLSGCHGSEPSDFE